MTLWTLKDNFVVSDRSTSPSTYSNEKVIISVNSSNIPNTWTSAGWCRALYQIPDIGEVRSKWEKLALNEQITLTFPTIADYRIFFELKTWISSVNISIWEGS